MNICKRGDDDAVTGLKTVTALQTGLTKLKYKMVTDSGTTVIVDGEYGTGTRNALKQFIADNGLPGDGEAFFADANAVMTMKLAAIPAGTTGITQAQVDAAVATAVKPLNQRVTDLETSNMQKTAELTNVAFSLRQIEAVKARY